MGVMLGRWCRWAVPALVLSSVSGETRFFENSAVEDVLPKAPADYPDNLQGIIWMDQGGFFGHSDVPFNAPDLACSFGDTAFHRLDPDTRVLKVTITGPAWQWMNKFLGYVGYNLLGVLGFFYEFQWNEDYSVAQTLPGLDLGMLGVYQVPMWLMSFTMVLQTPPEGACPPAKGASKKDIAKCAKWDRVSSGFLSPLLGSYGVLHYYVYQIVDKDGKRVQPFYDAFLEWANQNTDPGPKAAGLLGLDLGKTGLASGTSFVGLRSDTKSKASKKEL